MTVSVSHIRRIRLMSLAAMALALSACSVLPKSETLTVYQLPFTPSTQKPQAATGKENRLPLSLRIATPYSGQAIDSTRVLVAPQGSQISAYSGARWSDPAPILIRNRLARAFRADGRFASVSIDHDAGSDSDFELGGDLSAFQAVYENGAPVVHIHYDAMLIQSASHRSVATHRFNATESVHGKEVPEVIEAFGRAADRLSAEVLEWALQGVQAPQARQ